MQCNPNLLRWASVCWRDAYQRLSGQPLSAEARQAVEALVEFQINVLRSVEGEKAASELLEAARMNGDEALLVEVEKEA